jgi:leader peptidase (prepilin peptidase)/N-methyltransferase
VDWLQPAQLEPAQWQAGVACLLVCGVLGWFVPTLIARVPEPKPDPAADDPEAPVVERKLFDRSLPPKPDKLLYVEIAAEPRLAVWTAAWCALVGAAFGTALGWTGALVYLVPLVPIGVALMIIDWRTTLLPTRIIYPTYALMAVLIPLAALVDRDLDSLLRAGWGWLVIGGWFWIWWFLFNAWGFGDVRLSRVLGPALGYLGWYEMLMGLALILVVGAIGGLGLVILSRNVRRRVPYGPFLLVGSALAVVIGPTLAQGLGY